jgi:chitodextrinase
MKTATFGSSSPRRWGILFTALLLAGYAFGLPLDAAALAVPRGPYLQLGTQSSIVVRWRTDTATDSRVRYGTSPTELRNVIDDAATTTEHVVKLTDLNPATQYYYSIGNSTATLAGGDENHFFVTAPTPGAEQPTHIWVVGDSGTAKSNARAVRDAYLNHKGSRNTHLWLMPGDNAYIDGTDSEYQAALFDMYPTLLRQTVLWPTLGDHDGHTADSASQSGPYYDIFTLPKQGEAGGVASGTEAYYSFDYANIHFVVLDSVETSRAPTGAMLTWLKNDLAATTQPWVIAYWHHSPYSKGLHDFNSEIRLREMRQNVLPILEEAGVDLVLSAHSNSYERSFLIDGHYGNFGTFDSATMLVDGGDGRIDGNGAYQKSTVELAPGTVYAMTGSFGRSSVGSSNPPLMYVSLKVLGSMLLDVDGPVLDATFLDDTGQIRDHFRMVKTTSTARSSISAANVTATDASPTTLPRNAFLGTYFDNVDFTNQFFTRTDNAINFDWGSGAPASGMGTDYFSARWEGNWDLAQSGTYRFNVTSNDGVRIWVDNVLILDQWRDQNTSFTKDHSLSAGTHRIKVEHYEGLNTARITVSWLLVGGTQTDTTPPSTPSGLSATAVSSSQINLSWNASTDNVGVTGYRVERCQGAGCANFVQVATPSGTSYSVRAADAAGNFSGYSVTASVTTQSVSTASTVNADKVTTALTINGQLSESSWSLQTNVTKSVIGTGNNTTTFDVLWDNTYLYVGAKVMDATLNNDSVNVWDDDSVEIYIDPNHLHGTTYDTTDIQLITGYNDTSLFVKGGNTTSILHASAPITGGYAVELAIPWTRLGITPTANMTIGFDLGVNVDDTGGGRDSQMLWNTPTPTAYQNTSGFGHAVLTASMTSDTTPPSIPTNLTATAVSSSQINLSWSASTDSVGVTGYKVFRCQGTGCTPTTQITTVSGTDYSDTSLSASTAYTYSVAALDAAGNTSANSNLAVATTTAGSGGSIPTPTKTAPIVDVKTFGAKGDSVTDDTAAIQRALDSMTNGGTLVFPPGTYRYTSALRVTRPGTKLWGYGGATLHNGVSRVNEITLTGANTAMYGFRLTTAPITRGSGVHAQIGLRGGPGQEAIDNQLVGPANLAGLGILTWGASDFLIARNHVEKTAADAIWMVGGSRNGKVLENVVRDAGDDMVGVVSTIGWPINYNILIEGNDVAQQFWGRGISVVGGKDVTIRNNTVTHTYAAAGIIITQEDNFNTWETRNILAEGNKISHVQTTGTPKNNFRTHHASIHLWAENSGKRVENVMLRNNVIDDVINNGIAVTSNSCKVGIIGNRMTRIPSEAIRISTAISSTCNVACSGNTDEGQPVSNSQCGGPLPSVTGYTP